MFGVCLCCERIIGSLVGYIIYGFILGTIYAFLDRIWVRLFIQSDPLNREPEGLGLHFLRSIGWGGLVGGGGWSDCLAEDSGVGLTVWGAAGIHLLVSVEWYD